jgi:hypothetical protein
MTREEIFKRLALAFPELTPEAIKQLAPRISGAIGRVRTSKHRGPVAKNHARDRQILRLWHAYRARHGCKSTAALASKFIASLPTDLRPAANARGRGNNASTAKTLATLLSRAKTAERQRPLLRRLTSFMTECERLTARGTLPASAARGAIRKFRRGEAKFFGEIEALIHQHELLRHSATAALLGDAHASFIRLPPEK